MTMRTLHGPTKKQLPIPPSRAIKTNAVRNPIPFLDALSAIRAFRLVVRAQEERHSHRKRKNQPDNAYRQRDWNGQAFRLDHHRRYHHTNDDKHQQDITNNGQDSKLTQLPPEQVFTILHIEPSHFPDCSACLFRRQRDCQQHTRRQCVRMMRAAITAPHPSARRRSSGPSSPLPQAREGSGRSRS